MMFLFGVCGNKTKKSLSSEMKKMENAIFIFMWVHLCVQTNPNPHHMGEILLVTLCSYGKNCLCDRIPF